MGNTIKKFTRRSLWRYAGIFCSILILFTASFEILSFLYRPLVLMPIAYTAYAFLKLLAIPVTFVGPVGSPGFCEYMLPHAVLQVTFACTGIYALFILLAGIISFPGPLKSKISGLAIAIPAFYIYSTIRLIVMGIVGYWFPGALDFVHSYLMELVNVGFIVFIYIIWIRHVEKSASMA